MDVENAKEHSLFEAICGEAIGNDGRGGGGCISNNAGGIGNSAGGGGEGRRCIGNGGGGAGPIVNDSHGGGGCISNNAGGIGNAVGSIGNNSGGIGSNFVPSSSFTDSIVTPAVPPSQLACIGGNFAAAYAPPLFGAISSAYELKLTTKNGEIYSTAGVPSVANNGEVNSVGRNSAAHANCLLDAIPKNESSQFNHLCEFYSPSHASNYPCATTLRSFALSTDLQIPLLPSNNANNETVESAQLFQHHGQTTSSSSSSLGCFNPCFSFFDYNSGYSNPAVHVLSSSSASSAAAAASCYDQTTAATAAAAAAAAAAELMVASAGNPNMAIYDLAAAAALASGTYPNSAAGNLNPAGFSFSLASSNHAPYYYEPYAQLSTANGLYADNSELVGQYDHASLTAYSGAPLYSYAYPPLPALGAGPDQLSDGGRGGSSSQPNSNSARANSFTSKGSTSTMSSELATAQQLLISNALANSCTTFSPITAVSSLCSAAAAAAAAAAFNTPGNRPIGPISSYTVEQMTLAGFDHSLDPIYSLAENRASLLTRAPPPAHQSAKRSQASCQYAAGVSHASSRNSAPNAAGASLFGTSPAPAASSAALCAAFAQKPLSVERMREYLTQPEKFDCVISIFHAKVAQKSYGNEKRFFCPPPCVYLVGEGWRTRRKVFDAFYWRFLESEKRAKHEANTAGGERAADAAKSSSSGQNGAAGMCTAPGGTNSSTDMAAELCAVIGISGGGAVVEQDRLQLDFSNAKDYCAAKTLYISDADKRKYFHLFVSFFMSFGLNIGTFPSQRIKVISKPSKKKQSMKTNDCKYLSICGGSRVALFNRLRSQTVSTRYLHVDGGNVHASSTKWGAFMIRLIEEYVHAKDSNGHYVRARPPPSSDAPITYGSIIQLIDCTTGVVLPKLRIRKVDKHMTLLDPAVQGEPVSQLHKCAFQLEENEMYYLCLQNDKITRLLVDKMQNNRHQISDGASWTIISTDKAEYRFYEAMGPVQNPVTPMPEVKAVNTVVVPSSSSDGVAGAGQMALELNGYNFSGSLTVWFDATAAETSIRSTEQLRAIVPPLATVLANSVKAIVSLDKVDVPLTLSRQDGVIYPIGLTFSYSNVGVEIGGKFMASNGANHHQQQQQQQPLPYHHQQLQQQQLGNNSQAQAQAQGLNGGHLAQHGLSQYAINANAAAANAYAAHDAAKRAGFVGIGNASEKSGGAMDVDPQDSNRFHPYAYR